MSSTKKRKARPKARAKPKAHITRKRPVTAKKPAEKAEAAPESKPVAREKTFLLAVRLKGSFGAPKLVERTLSALRLKRKFNAVLLEDGPGVVAMLRHAKDYVTWGELKTKDIALLLRERAEFLGDLPITDKSVQERFGEKSIDELATAIVQGRIQLHALWQKGLRPVFRLHPPSGGFEMSTKRPYQSDGELGHRGSEIALLVARMT